MLKELLLVRVSGPRQRWRYVGGVSAGSQNGEQRDGGLAAALGLFSVFLCLPLAIFSLKNYHRQANTFGFDSL